MVTQVIFTIDTKIKNKAMKRAKAAGVPFAAILKLATRAYADGALDLGVSMPEQFNAKTARELHALLKDLSEKKNILSFKSAADADAYLLAD